MYNKIATLGRITILVAWVLTIVLPMIAVFTVPFHPLRIELLNTWRFSLTWLVACSARFLMPNVWNWVATGRIDKR